MLHQVIPLQRALALLFASALSIAPATLWGHGAPPEGKEIFVVDGGWVYLTNFGVMTSEKPMHYVCEEAFFAHANFTVAPFALDRWATFSRTAATVTTDGCGFDVRLGLPGAPRAVAVSDDTEEVAITVRDEGASEIWHSPDGGITWDLVDVDFDGILLGSLGFLGPGEVVAVGYLTDEERRGEAVLARVDLGTGDRVDLEVDSDLVYPDLLDARGGDLLWHARRDGATEVFWSHGDDLVAGKYVSANWPTSGALAPDKSRAYLGGVDEDNRGVFRAHRGDPSTWEEVVPGHRALCLAVDGDDLLVCGHRRDDGHDLARWRAGEELEALVDFRSLEGFRQDCPEGTRVPQTCPPVWPELAQALGITIDEEDAHHAPAEEGSEAPPDESSGRCSTTGNSGSGTLLIALLLIGWAVRRRPTAG